MPSQKLSPKQLRFCQQYVKDLNASASAVRAGYSKKTAQEQSSRLLSKVIIRSKIKELQDKMANKLEISAEKVISELAKCGFTNIQDYIEDDNGIKDLTKIPKDAAAAVESIKTVTTSYETKAGIVTTRNVSMKLTDKISALEKLGRHLGIFEKDNRQKESRISLINDIPKRKSKDGSEG